VVVTVGILVTTLLPLVALLSAAMDTSGKATNNTLGARISAQLVSEIQQADWQKMSDWHDKDFFYDAQGLRLTSAKAEEDSVYTARAHLLPVGVMLATAGSPPSNQWQRQMVTMVVARPGSVARETLDAAVAALTGKSKLPKDVRVSRTLLVNMEKATSP